MRDFLERRFPHRWRRPHTDIDRRGVHGGYTPPDNFMTENERAEALFIAIEQCLAQHRDDERDE